MLASCAGRVLAGEVDSQSGGGERLPPSQGGRGDQRAADEEGAEEHHLGDEARGVPAVRPQHAEGRARQAGQTHDGGHAVPETKL